jgi:hypothetical protein
LDWLHVFLVSSLFDGLIGALAICGAICLVALAIRRGLKEMKHNDLFSRASCRACE